MDDRQGQPASAALDYPARVAAHVESVILEAERVAATIRKDADSEARLVRAEAERARHLAAQALGDARAAAHRLLAEAERDAQARREAVQRSLEQLVSGELDAVLDLGQSMSDETVQLMRHMAEVTALGNSLQPLASRLVDRAAQLERARAALRVAAESDDDALEPQTGAAAANGSGSDEDAESPDAGDRSTGDGGEVERGRLFALELAMAGRTRAEVEERLERSLTEDEQKAIVDDVFGAGTSGESRIPWAQPAQADPSDESEKDQETTRAKRRAANSVP